MSLKQIIRKPFRYENWNAAYIIIGINILVFFLERRISGLADYLSLSVVGVVKFKYFWQFFTYMFTHDPGGFSHLIFNMLGLFFFGLAVERIMGSREFLLFYVTSGLFCGLFSFAVYYFTGYWYVFLCGASGAIYALLFAYAVLRPTDRIFIWGIIPVPAPLLIAAYAGIEIASQLLSIRNGVAHMTHLAGFAFAWMYFVIRIGVNPWKVWKEAWR